MIDDRIISLILAGGKSSRMGTDKALLEIEGKSLLQRVCETAAKLTSQVYVLTDSPDRYRSILTADYQLIPDRNPGAGPLVALSQGLSEINAEWILLLGCDLPLLDADIIQNWERQLPELPTSTLAVVPYQNDRWEPLCGFYRDRSLSSLQKFIDNGGRSFQAWLSQIPAVPLPAVDRASLMLSNCNTPEEFEQLKAK
ncbi:MAG: molybdenum cofactor guanylyltransferase [Oscillatoriales cyanobacterium RU_3_3]|nr:molybdenum cofactor guanylyltransferase [Oscillatoriales cyanobacterium RU_3_3]